MRGPFVDNHFMEDILVTFILEFKLAPTAKLRQHHQPVIRQHLPELNYISVQVTRGFRRSAVSPASVF
jgi:hypothetical protein